MNIPENILPSDIQILRDALMVYPRTNLYKDINKDLRQGFIVGQRFLIQSIRNELHFPVIKEPVKLPSIKAQLDYYNEEKLLRKQITLIDQVILSKELSAGEKIDKLEDELSNILDVDLFMQTRSEIERLDEKIQFEEKLKSYR